MPISSGALEWPKSYFRKPVETEAESSRTDEGLEWWWGVKSPRGVAPLNYEWQPQLSAREDYEKWRKEMDRKGPLKSRKKKKQGGCCCFCCGTSMSSKVHSKEVVENPPKGGNRDDPRKVIRRRRRRVCCCLTLWLSLLFLLIAAAVVFVFIYLTGHVVLKPNVECNGRWGVHFMGSKTTYNGTDKYTCCFLPDINKTVVDIQTTKGKNWPEGYLIPNGTCAKSKDKCEDYKPPKCTSECFDPSVPPCEACVSCIYRVSLVVLGCLLATMF